MSVSIVWFRNDLRLADNPALYAAVERGILVPVFIHAPEEESPWQPGAASNWWLHQSLKALDQRLEKLNSRLIIRRGSSLNTLRSIIRETGATSVFFNKRYEPAIAKRDDAIRESLTKDGIEVKEFASSLLCNPEAVKNKSGNPFQIFTPFLKHCLAQLAPEKPLPSPKQIASPARWPESLPLDDLELEPKIDWAGGLRKMWQPGEETATATLKTFSSRAFHNYSKNRDFPAHPATSRLSPHLHFGELTPRQIWHAIETVAGTQDRNWKESKFVAELFWREFAHHLLVHFPETPEKPLRKNFEKFPWHSDDALLRAWQRGQTGYPIVDAGMRELWQTGWMHNRVRMIAGSFLVKDLLQPWQSGARWFWDTLVDADLANNTLGWQWIAGCGADAAPYFRILNPVSQGEKFDPNGDYIRRWCPELAQIPAKWIHQPHVAPTDVLRAAEVEIGGNYPAPIVDHSKARIVALNAFASIKTGKSNGNRSRVWHNAARR